MGVPYKASRIYCTGNSPKGATGALAPPPPGIQNYANSQKGIKNFWKCSVIAGLTKQNEAKNAWIYANQITVSIGYDLCRQASQLQIHILCLS